MAKEISLFKKFPDSGLASTVLVPADDYIWLPCKSPVINFMLGGGIPYGKMVEFLGEESSGKSLLAYDFMRSAQKLGGMGILIDAEFAFEERWAKVNGLDLTKIHIYQENEIESISDFIAESVQHYRFQLKQNQPIVLIIDSLAALDTKLNMDTTAADAKAEMGNRAKAIYRMVRVNNALLSKLGIVTIVINQLRDKVGANSMFESNETSPGGKAMRFYAAQRIGLYVGAQLTEGTGENKRRVGNSVSFRIKKNKVAPPRATYKTEVIFDESYGETGFSKYLGLRPILLDLGTIEKQGNAYFFDGQKIAGGKDEFDEVMVSDKELRQDLLHEAGINTLSSTKAKLEKLTKLNGNLYAV
jgi:recombination protein RecA